jgi:hypothetical protein
MCRLWPHEASALQALGKQTQPIATPPQNLYPIAGSSVIPHTDLAPLLLSIAGIRYTASRYRCFVA